VLYAPQLILSELADRFMAAKPEAGLLISPTLIPLAFVPLIYGIFLKS
jgi:MFS transporter, YNFM family, putative membrane transport protein